MRQWIMGLFSRKPAFSREVGEDTSLVGNMRYYNPDDLVGRKGLSIYHQMKKDPQVSACLSIKRFSVLSRGWDVIPNPLDESRGIEVSDFCKWALERIPGSITRVLWNISDAVAMGYSVNNVVWDVVKTGKYAGYWVPAMIKHKKPDDWAFDVDEYLNIVGVRHIPTDKLYPASRFLLYSHDVEYENPYGTSELRSCYRSWWSKDFLGRYWNLYLEKYGSPTVRGYYRRGTPKAVQEHLLRDLERIQVQSAIVLPDDMKADLLETIRQGDTGYRLAIEFHNREIAKSILNMTLITDDGGQGVGSFALAKVHLDVLRMCLKGLKLDLEESVMTEQLLKPLVEYNFGKDVPVPRFTLGQLEEKDLPQLTKSIKDLVDCGVLKSDDPMILDYLGLGAMRFDLPTAERVREGEDTNEGNVRVGV